MDTIQEQFVKTGFVELLRTLHPADMGKWGKMNAQQMTEHVIVFFEVSSNRLHFPLMTPEEQLPKYKEFLLSDKAFRENTKAPESVVPAEPLPLRKANMPAAIDELTTAIETFFAYFASDPLQTTLHPAFGYLNFDEWLRLHYKHVVHHAKQFGLI